VHRGRADGVFPIFNMLAHAVSPYPWATGTAFHFWSVSLAGTTGQHKTWQVRREAR
jgi:hypothetical protein